MQWRPKQRGQQSPSPSSKLSPDRSLLSLHCSMSHTLSLQPKQHFYWQDLGDRSLHLSTEMCDSTDIAESPREKHRPVTPRGVWAVFFFFFRGLTAGMWGNLAG